MKSVSSAACASLDRIFPEHEKILHGVGTRHMIYYTKVRAGTNLLEKGKSDREGLISSEEDIEFRSILSLRGIKGASNNESNDLDHDQMILKEPTKHWISKSF
uniref:AlNc14C293G10263 protein n=1 Tax=Albugo laibachii Nc14 TaxID=890382 RepID=F0WVB9_9STRA|nr:AlNc14C293G10263 [Albugo laibachii Nc14]|eukprot:CCA25358.1 AlNc14C293G10263 [Albugo laibachii Nc14]